MLSLEPCLQGEVGHASLTLPVTRHHWPPPARDELADDRDEPLLDEPLLEETKESPGAKRKRSPTAEGGFKRGFLL